MIKTKEDFDFRISYL